jgi:ATP/ADP translocase
LDFIITARENKIYRRGAVFRERNNNLQKRRQQQSINQIIIIIIIIVGSLQLLLSYTIQHTTMPDSQNSNADAADDEPPLEGYER